MTHPSGYSVTGYGDMITDKVRMDAYAAALRRAVTPGCVVLDIGAGTGIFSLLACQYGARRVFAVEPNDAIQVGRELAAANGYADRITFIQGISTALDLPEQADVIISDLRGLLPLFEQHIPAIVDARTRHLAPGGTLIPQCDTIWAAILEDDKLHRTFTAPWANGVYGLDLRATLPYAVNSWGKGRAGREQLVGEPQRVATLDYRTITSPNVRADLTFTPDRAATGSGLLLWFDAELAEGIGFFNAPGQPPLIYGGAFFPWPAPVQLDPAWMPAVTLHANLVQGDYLWRWRTTGRRAGEAAPAFDFQQSTFFGGSFSPARLAPLEAGHVPLLDRQGEVQRTIFALADGTHSAGEIARALIERFPDEFSDAHQALVRVTDALKRYQAQGATR